MWHEVPRSPGAHVTSENRDRKGTGENLRGAEIVTCKIAGIAYEGPLNLALAPNSVRVDGLGRSTRTGRYGLNGVNYNRSVGGRECLTVSVARLLVQSAATTAVAWRLHRWAMEQGSKAPPSLA
jgi:hypothetical protein